MSEQPSPVDLDDRVTWSPLVPTGDVRVDEAAAPLEDLAGRPVHEHVAVFEAVHAGLRSVLDATTAG